MSDNILEPNLNGYTPVTDWDKVIVILQQANELLLRGASIKDLSKWIIGDIEIQGSDFYDLPVAETTAPVALPIPTTGNKFGFLADGRFTQPTGGTLEYSETQWGLTLFDGTKWVKRFTLDLPQTDTSNLTPKDDFNRLEVDLFGNPEIPVYQKFRDNIATGLNPDIVSNTQASGYYLGASQSTNGLIYVSSFPADTYTYYVKLRFSNKGAMHSIAYFSGTTTIGTIAESQISVNQDFSFAFTVTRSAAVDTPTLIAQIRTRYPALASTPASFVIVEFSAFKGTYTKEQIESSRTAVPDKSKVRKAALSDTATKAMVAETVEKMPDGYFDSVESRVDKITQKFGDSIAEWNSITNVTSSYLTRNNGKLQFGGTVANFTGSSGTHRLWSGIDVRPALYATESKTFYIVVKGVITGNNIRNFIIKSAGSRVNEILRQDMENGLTVEFELIREINYPAGSTTNDRYIYTDYSVWAGKTDIGFDAEFEVFALFEKNDTTEKFVMDDFLKAAKGEYQILNAEKLPKNLATQTFVEEKISNIVVSNSLTYDDLIFMYAIMMVIVYGQSLAVGGGAGSAVNDYVNSLTFAGGSSLFSVPFTTAAEKEAYFSSGFKLMNEVTTAAYPPATAALTAIHQLIKDENGVDLNKFGGQFIPQTGGVSGSSITTMIKGTTAYANIMEVIAKAVEFANASGKTFGVPAFCWVHGEADRSQTQAWYYSQLSQLFTDLNADIKAITGQTEDVQFVIHQTSPWRKVWYPSGSFTQQTGDTVYDYKMGVQKAQLQLVLERANVHMLGGTYQYNYGTDFFHPNDRAVIGLPLGYFIKRLINDGVAMPTFRPLSHKLVGNFIHLKFDVPVKPARFDIGTDIWHNGANGKIENWGFRVYKNDIDIISAEPFIVQGDTVVIPCSESPIGAIVWYAADGHWRGGNLCDSMNITIKNKNVNYVFDNFSIAFDDYLII